jgi:hypothetical protein
MLSHLRYMLRFCLLRCLLFGSKSSVSVAYARMSDKETTHHIALCLMGAC